MNVVCALRVKRIEKNDLRKSEVFVAINSVFDVIHSKTDGAWHTLSAMLLYQ